MQSTHTLLCLAAGAGIAIAGAHVRQAIERTTMDTDPALIREARASAALDGETQSEPAKARTLDDLFAAIAKVETGGETDPDSAIGDGGRSRGRYQIGFAYWRDAWETPNTDAGEQLWIRGTKDAARSRETMWLYWGLWCRDARTDLDFETLARVHNGGPRGAEKESTLVYWSKVRSAMENTR